MHHLPHHAMCSIKGFWRKETQLSLQRCSLFLQRIIFLILFVNASTIFTVAQTSSTERLLNIPTSRTSTGIPSLVHNVESPANFPSFSPTTRMPTLPYSKLLTNLGMTLKGVSYDQYNSSNEARIFLEVAIGNHIKNYFQKNESTEKIYNIAVGTKITSSYAAVLDEYGTRPSQSVGNTEYAMTIIYEQEIEFETPLSFMPKTIATRPFIDSNQLEFINDLKGLSSAFNQLVTIDNVNLSLDVDETYHQTVKNLEMHLYQMMETIDLRSQYIWSNAMHQHVNNFSQSKVRNGDFTVSKLTAESIFVSQALVANVLTIKYDLKLSYKSPEGINPDQRKIASQPFEQVSDQKKFIQFLTAVKDAQFINVVEFRDGPGIELPTTSPVQNMLQSVTNMANGNDGNVIIENSFIPRSVILLLIILGSCAIFHLLLLDSLLHRCVEWGKQMNPWNKTDIDFDDEEKNQLRGENIELENYLERSSYNKIQSSEATTNDNQSKKSNRSSLVKTRSRAMMLLDAAERASGGARGSARKGRAARSAGPVEPAEMDAVRSRAMAILKLSEDRNSTVAFKGMNHDIREVR